MMKSTTRHVKPYHDLKTAMKYRVKSQIKKNVVPHINSLLTEREIEVDTLLFNHKFGNLDDVTVKAGCKRKYDELTLVERKKVATMAVTKDVLRMSHGTYAGIRRLCKGLPFLSHVKNFLKEIESSLEPILPVPGFHPGGYLTLESEAKILFSHEYHMGNFPQGSEMIIKVAADGTLTSKKQVGTVYTLEISNNQKPLNIALTGLVLAKDNYESMKSTMLPLFNQFSSLGKITHFETEEGYVVPTKTVVGGDMMWQLAGYGCSNPTSKNPCELCIIPKQNFFMVCQTEDLWKRVMHPPLARTRQSIMDDCCATPKKNSIKHIPLIPLPVGLNTPLYKVVVLDILHMRLRIANLLIRNSIFDCEMATSDPLAKKMEALFRSISLRFTTYPSNKPGNVKVAWTSLSGGEMRKALSVVGPAILSSSGVFQEQHKEHLGKLWIDTNYLLCFVNSCNKEDAPQAAQLGKDWTAKFLECGRLGMKGFATTNLTPYAHMLGVHVPGCIAEHGALRNYSGEKLEKKNDEVKKTLLRQTNHIDILECMKVEKRREKSLMEAEKIEKQSDDEKQKKVKKSSCQHPYFAHGVKDKAAQAYESRISAMEQANTLHQNPRELATISDLQSHLNEINGSRTRLRNRDRLNDAIDRWEEMTNNANLEIESEEVDEQEMQMALVAFHELTQGRQRDQIPEYVQEEIVESWEESFVEETESC